MSSNISWTKSLHSKIIYKSILFNFIQSLILNNLLKSIADFSFSKNLKAIENLFPNNYPKWISDSW